MSLWFCYFYLITNQVEHHSVYSWSMWCISSLLPTFLLFSLLLLCLFQRNNFNILNKRSLSLESIKNIFPNSIACYFLLKGCLTNRISHFNVISNFLVRLIVMSCLYHTMKHNDIHYSVNNYFLNGEVRVIPKNQ